jgi:soluble lytic murein transglycosylase
MKRIFLLLPLSIFFIIAPQLGASVHEKFVTSDVLKLSKTDHILGEHMVSMMKLIEQGYINKDTISKVITEAERSANFKVFVPWLKSVRDISRFTKASELIPYCRVYQERREKQSLERVLERLAGNYCRERTLEAISRDIEKSNQISDEATQFIQSNFKFFLTKKNKKNFAFFIQSQSSRPEILKKISQDVTSFSVQHQIVPSQEVLKDILINDQITKLIQDKGFNLIQPQNVFYAEYGKLIELGYKAIDGKPQESKIKEHYHFLKNYLDLNQDHLPVGLCLTRLNDFAKAVFRAGFKDLSQDIFKFILKKNNKEIQEDALFFYLWTHLFKNEFKEALNLADKYDLIENHKKIQDPRLKFWIAYTHEKLDQTKEALAIYEEIVTSHPLSYYSIMSVKKVQSINPDSKVVKFYANTGLSASDQLSFDPKQLSADHISSLIRLKAWAKIDSQRLMRLELKRLKRFSMPEFIVSIPTARQLDVKSDLHLINAQIILDSENYLSTFRYLYEVLDSKEVAFNRSLLSILYPKPYLEDLTALLKKDNLDPIIVLSLIRQESVFNPLARSPVGARGLMQLMPTTARRLRRSVREKQLVIPKTNLELGTLYFKGLMKRYEGNLVYVLAAYNAGESRVERWKGGLFDSDETILKNIEAIPFLETRNYVKLIFRNIFFYKLLLEQNELADPSEPNKIFDVKLGFKH